MNQPVDLAVIGAGPAGVAAAIEGARLGLTTALVDEQGAAGGQVYRVASSAVTTAGGSKGEALRRALANAGVHYLPGRRVWLPERGYRIHLLGPAGAERLEARALILATGAHERVAPVKGWTLPGVIGLAAATALIKAEGVLPGRRIVVAGRGPLLLLVAQLIVRHGGEVAAVVDGNGPTDWLARGALAVSRLDLLLEGLGWTTRVLGARVPVLFRASLAACLGEDRVEAVEVVRGDRRSTIACDAVCYGLGLTPATELSRQLGARHGYSPRDGWTVTVDADGRTDLAGLYACGDGAGVLGAAAAPGRGRLAASAAARDLGKLDAAAFERAARPLRRAITRAGRFGAAMTRLAPPGEHQIRHATPATLICRCEGVTRAEIEAAIDAGERTSNGLKSATRCGMGPCGGRYCAESAAQLLARATGRNPGEVGQMTGRPPARPLPMGAIMGAFRYEDIPFPEPAPL